MAINILKVIHIVNTVLMAWPFYALVIVAQRVRLGPPLGDRADTYMENIIKNRTIPCFIFQATALITGLALVRAMGLGLDVFFTNWVLGLKFFLLVVIGAMLTFVHLNMQPKIDRLFAQAEGAENIPAEIASQIGVLRLRRKQFASVCMFIVFVEVILGVQAWVAFPLWLNAALVVVLALFTWRAYSSQMPYGWV